MLYWIAYGASSKKVDLGGIIKNVPSDTQMSSTRRNRSKIIILQKCANSRVAHCSRRCQHDRTRRSTSFEHSPYLTNNPLAHKEATASEYVPQGLKITAPGRLRNLLHENSALDLRTPGRLTDSHVSRIHMKLGGLTNSFNKINVSRSWSWK